MNTDASLSLARAFRAIVAATQSNPAQNLFLLCHGYSGVNLQGRVCEDAGGMGLQLGLEDLLHSNVMQWNAIKNRVRHIVVYACGAADTPPQSEGTSSDGRYLMRALAYVTGAAVYAADRMQWYTTYGNSTRGRFEFGSWEGRLWCFLPDGYTAYPVASAPTELADVFAGK